MAPAADAAPAPSRPAPDALGRHLSRAVLQRKSLGQLGWLPPLKPSGTSTLVGDGRRATVYKETEPAAPDKLAALQQAARSNARVGWTVDEEAWKAWSEQYKWASNPKWRNDKWTRGANFGREDYNSVDPFFYEVTVPYKHNNQPRTLKLRFQHASSYTGYVETVYDSGNTGASDSPSMYDFVTEASLKGKKSTDGTRNLLYSNKHETRSRTNLFDETYDTTEESFDAYTKIAGEGARWVCVRNHAADLRNDSYFYVTYTDERGYETYWGVKFIGLWLSWDSVFGKAYNISDDWVASAIRRGDFGDEVVELRRPSSKDYDLEA